MVVTRKKGKKNRKFGRNKIKCARYLAEGRRKKNKERKAQKRARRISKRTGEALASPDSLKSKGLNMTKKQLYAIRRLIEKECQRNSLAELCECYDVTCEDFEDFLDMAEKYFELQEMSGIGL